MDKQSKLIPSKQEILDYLNKGNPFRKKEMAENLNVPKNCRANFRRLLQAMEKNGEISNAPQIKQYNNNIKQVGIFTVTELTSDGDLLCIPDGFTGENKPIIYITANSPAKVGDRILGRTQQQDKNIYSCKIIKIISDTDKKIIGILSKNDNGFELVSSDRKDRNSYFVSLDNANEAQHNDIVIATPIHGGRGINKNAEVITRIGSTNDAKCFSILGIAKYNLPFEFSNEVLTETENITVPNLKNRTDLRHIPLVTIDGADARDFDDAVYAEKSDSGFKLLIAIADVAHYVTSESKLDNEALKRGNSVYFPDRVIPMLPEKLSNGLCSLVADEDRACIAVWIEIDNNGEIQNYKFVRGLMKSQARLTYEAVQSAYDGNFTDKTIQPIMPHIKNLYQAYEALAKARKNRNTLELDIPENQVFINEYGVVEKIQPRTRLNSHKLIEEFMISANVATAMALQNKKQQHIMYRIHDHPPRDKLENLNNALEQFNVKVPMDGGLRPSHFANLLSGLVQSEDSQFISDLVLRTQAQAQYNSENIGHFGLALQNYCHFTSPIRRYSDLLIHRALIDAYKLGDDGLAKKHKQQFDQIAEDLSNTERTAQKAERETMDKYLAKFMAGSVGATFDGKISGVNDFAMFIRLITTGAEGVIFLKNIPNDYYVHDNKKHCVFGRKTKKTFRMGDLIQVKLEQVKPIKGGLEFSIVDNDILKKTQNKNSNNQKLYKKDRKKPSKYKK